MSAQAVQHDGVDHLTWLEAAARDPRGARWMSPTRLCVYDADTVRRLLRNEDGNLVGHSDFFGQIGRTLQPRAQQVALGRAGLELMSTTFRTADYSAAIDRLGAQSEWPVAGLRLMASLARPALARSSRSRAFQKALDRLIEARIIARDQPPSRFRALIDRFKLSRATIAEVERIDAPPGERDVLDVIASLDGPVKDELLVHLYAAHVFALVSSLGLSLAWAVLLAVQHRKYDVPPRDIVREALRLYPIAWLLERTPKHTIEVLGETVTPNQTIVISPYATHRSPQHWEDPEAFRPERWQGTVDRRSWIPFGAGPQSCIAGSLTLDTVSHLLSRILASVEGINADGTAPVIGAALAPPRFRLLRAESAPISRALLSAL